MSLVLPERGAPASCALKETERRHAGSAVNAYMACKAGAASDTGTQHRHTGMNRAARGCTAYRLAACAGSCVR
jgi:hypothetical protein